MLFYNDQDCYLARKHMYTIDIFNTRIQEKTTEGRYNKFE